jgi:hypothetical protein
MPPSQKSTSPPPLQLHNGPLLRSREEAFTWLDQQNIEFCQLMAVPESKKEGRVLGREMGKVQSWLELWEPWVMVQVHQPTNDVCYEINGTPYMPGSHRVRGGVAAQLLYMMDLNRREERRLLSQNGRVQVLIGQIGSLAFHEAIQGDN